MLRNSQPTCLCTERGSSETSASRFGADPFAYPPRPVGQLVSLSCRTITFRQTKLPLPRTRRPLLLPRTRRLLLPPPCKVMRSSLIVELDFVLPPAGKGVMTQCMCKPGRCSYCTDVHASRRYLRHVNQINTAVLGVGCTPTLLPPQRLENARSDHQK